MSVEAVALQAEERFAFGNDETGRRLGALFMDSVDHSTIEWHQGDGSVVATGSLRDEIDGTKVLISVFRFGRAYHSCRSRRKT